ncbi:Conserved_hypothetical protein [Hexamita inflata]|uniref:Uncharacterized protein n=1 Tax=Hexamita inflata TaxID=28002 RepID=A0AA86QAP4_9EUKA|nr:Conserved hypothetical protein [Hexamita inflata]
MTINARAAVNSRLNQELTKFKFPTNYYKTQWIPKNQLLLPQNLPKECPEEVKRAMLQMQGIHTNSQVGPGQYNIPTESPNGIKIKENIQQYQKEFSSPGRYEIPKISTSRNILIKQNVKPRRPKLLKEDVVTPGPGAYKVEPKSPERKTVFVTKQVIKEKPMPGPLEYSHLPDFSIKRAKSSMDYGRLESKVPHTPPDFYINYSDLVGKQQKIPEKYDNPIQPDDTPAPYDTRDAHKYIKPQLKSGKINERFTLGSNTEKFANTITRIWKLEERLKEKTSTPSKVNINQQSISKQQRITLLEKNKPYMTFLTQNPLEIHFTVAGDSYYKGAVHGAVFINKQYPHNNPEIKIFNDQFKSVHQITSCKLEPGHGRSHFVE